MARTLDFALFFCSLLLAQSATCTLIRIGSCFRNGQQEDCQYTSNDKYEIDIQQDEVVRQVNMAVDGNMNEVYTHFTAGIMVTSLIIYLALCFTQAKGPEMLDNLVRFLAI